MTLWLALSNRPENLKVLINYVEEWAIDRGLPTDPRSCLEKAVEEIFRHMVIHAYQPDQPGVITISLEQRGTRLNLIFEDDAAFHNPGSLSGLSAIDGTIPADRTPNNGNGLQQLAESFVYYRTTDRKNRLVVSLVLREGGD